MAQQKLFRNTLCCCGPPGCDCSVEITVEGCDGATPLSGATVTVGSITPGTTNEDGVVTIDLCPGQSSGSQSYQVTVSAPAYITYSNTLSLTCGGSYTIKLTANTSGTIEFSVTGCCSLPLPGATVTIGGTTYTTDSDGNAVIGITDAGTYPWSVSKSRFTTQTGSVTIPACQEPETDISLTMVPTSSYVSPPEFGTPNLADPIPTTLHLTDSVYGAVTLTYGTIPFGPLGGTPGWYGSLTVNYAGTSCCSATDGCTLFYQMAPCDTSFYELATVCQGPFFCNDPFALQDCPYVGTSGDTTGSTISTPITVGGIDNTATFAPTVPFDATITYNEINVCPEGGAGGPNGGGLIYYPSGATLTITE